jgi:hypothetical protein
VRLHHRDDPAFLAFGLNGGFQRGRDFNRMVRVIVHDGYSPDNACARKAAFDPSNTRQGLLRRTSSSKPSCQPTARADERVLHIVLPDNGEVETFDDFNRVRFAAKSTARQKREPSGDRSKVIARTSACGEKP